MKEFYIFLDIDGVLYDWDYIISEVNSGNMKKGGLITKFKKESIDALNYLIESLSKRYNVNVVITSSFRHNMNFIALKLRESNFNYEGILHKIGDTFPSSNRGKEIKKYLDGKKDYEFLIIDDEMFDYKEEFEKFDMIKTEIYHNALNLDMVKRFLSNKKTRSL